MLSMVLWSFRFSVLIDKERLCNKSNNLYVNIFAPILTSYNCFGEDGKTDTKKKLVT